MSNYSYDDLLRQQQAGLENLRLGNNMNLAYAAYCNQPTTQVVFANLEQAMQRAQTYKDVEYNPVLLLIEP